MAFDGLCVCRVDGRGNEHDVGTFHLLGDIGVELLASRVANRH